MNEYILSPEELFFLGTLLQAKYIDYAYIAAMDDIQENFLLKKKETISGLVNKGLVQEDFSGELEVGAELRALLEPVFFGVTETSLDVCYVRDNKHVDIYKFHHKNGKITLVTGKERMLDIKAIDDSFFVNALDYITRDISNICSEVLSSLEYNEITRMIAVKSSVVSGSSYVNTYFEVNNHLYTERETGELCSVSKEDFIRDSIAILRGD